MTMRTSRRSENTARLVGWRWHRSWRHDHRVLIPLGFPPDVTESGSQQQDMCPIGAGHHGGSRKADKAGPNSSMPLGSPQRINKRADISRFGSNTLPPTLRQYSIIMGSVICGNSNPSAHRKRGSTLFPTKTDSKPVCAHKDN